MALGRLSCGVGITTRLDRSSGVKGLACRGDNACLTAIGFSEPPVYSGIAVDGKGDMMVLKPGLRSGRDR